MKALRDYNKLVEVEDGEGDEDDEYEEDEDGSQEYSSLGDPEELTREQEIELVTKETMELDIQMREREGEQVLCDEATRLPCVAHKVIFKISIFLNYRYLKITLILVSSRSWEDGQQPDDLLWLHHQEGQGIHHCLSEEP